MPSSLHKIGPTATYYEATVALRPCFPVLNGTVTADVCVIGGGIAGCSAALHLAERGYRVALLEKHQIGWGASGRSGGQIIPGFASDQTVLEKAVGLVDARRLWDMSVEAIDLLRTLVARHGIDCDWHSGQLQVALKRRQLDALRAWHEQLQTRYGYRSTQLLDAVAVRASIQTDRYCGGLFDSNGGHLHPLNYTLGLARAAQRAGALLHERSAAIAIEHGPTIHVRTAMGSIRATYAVLAGNAYLGKLEPQLHTRIMPVATYVIATEPLGARAHELLANDWAVTDSNFILDYFRRSADDRLLFGGRVSYSGRDLFDSAAATRKRMLNVFPQLRDVRIDYAWSGLIDITMNRTPDFGRLGNNLYYLQGFSGHGIALAGMAGKLVADAIAGQSERFDVFGKIRHRAFPGGPVLRTPLLALAMLWYRLRDLL